MDTTNVTDIVICIEKRVRELETSLAVVKEKQSNQEKQLADFIKSVNESNEKQITKIEMLTKFMFVATGVLVALQALGIAK